ncbi:MAG: DUF2442 domain-containing protein [Chiayiivirga sp.]|jgi:hypothetical protein|nr:DUF2442 domain-containing protein [Chiayiivirga sp.]
MALDEQDIVQAESRLRKKASTHAVKARYVRTLGMIEIVLNTGVRISFPPGLAEGLSEAKPTQLNDIVVSPSGLGLHWPRLDADLYVPNLLRGILGSRKWMASTLGAKGGQVRSDAKAAAARENGRKGGRPRMTKAAA